LVGQVGAPLGSLTVDLIALGAFTIFAAAAMITARRVSRPEGAVLLTGYAVFLLVLIGQAT
jgi:Ca2+/Na+ antiporter